MQVDEFVGHLLSTAEVVVVDEVADVPQEQFSIGDSQEVLPIDIGRTNDIVTSIIALL